MHAFEELDLSIDGVPSITLCDLSEYATLAFVAAFDVQEVQTVLASPMEQKKRPAPKRVTYIALSKKTMPWLVQLYAKFKGQLDIYVDETLERVLSVSQPRYLTKIHLISQT
jgi:hypothetical protein